MEICNCGHTADRRKDSMGTYLNPGRSAYEEALNSEIFVDKSEMILYLNSVVKTKQKYVCVSRPRGFGKTMTADMICAYYDRKADSRFLFEHRKIAECKSVHSGGTEIRWDSCLGSFDVIQLVMTDFISDAENVSEGLNRMSSEILLELSEAYPEVSYDASDLSYSLDRFYRSTGIPFVVVLDEWDAVFRIRKNDLAGQSFYLEFLRDLLKDKPYIALAYMTGILPIKKDGRHCALNMFTEFSMMFPRQLARYTGFTESEVQSLCARYGRNYEAVKDWYDGYDVSDVVPPDPDHEELKATGKSHRAVRYALYSPLSVVEAMTTGVIKDYWSQTETYEALAEYIRKDYDGLKDAVALLMNGGSIRIDPRTFQNDMTTLLGRDDVLSLLVHLGYLAYDIGSSEVSIPNREIRNAFRAWKESYDHCRLERFMED